MQDITKNSFKGISPLANRNIFACYHIPTFIYGTDTVHVNSTDLGLLEVNYRSELKHMQSLPVHTSSSAVYLTIGVLCVEGMRDLEILGIQGQLAMCPPDQQKVTQIIVSNLEDYSRDFVKKL